MTHEPYCSIVTPKEQSMGRKRVAGLLSSNKHLSNDSGAKMEPKGGQNAAMSQRLHGPLHGSHTILSFPTRKSPSSTSHWKGQCRLPATTNDPH